MQVQRPRWDDTPKVIWVRVDKDQIKKSPLGNEVSVSATIDGGRYTAIVPVEALNDVNGTVVASRVGELGDVILVSFPAGSTGTATWAIPKKVIHLYLSEQDPRTPRR
jgi:hypothetical protein